MKNSFLIISSFILFLSSCVKDQLPEVLPSVISGTPTFEDKTIGWQNGQFINNTILVVTGEVLSNGENTKRGCVWANHPLPTGSDNILFDIELGKGPFRLTTKNFIFDTTYFIRVFAENSLGRVYGAVQEISSPSTDDLIRTYIGTPFEGGVLAYVDSTGHGLIAALSDTSAPFGYQVFGSSSNYSGTDIGTGLANTNAIILSQGAASSNNAAGIARLHNGGGYNDWFLPSNGELNLLYLNKEAIGGFSNGFYWSSSGNGIPEIANGIDFSSGVQAARIVGTLQYVRAIRYF